MKANNSLQRKTQNLMAEIKSKLEVATVKLTDEDLAVKKECEESLHAFIKRFWHIIEGGNTFSDNWHIRDITLHLQAAYEGRIRYLVINIPFRCMKSLICNVFFPAWLWTNKPNSKVFCLTGDKELALRDSVKCRRLMQCAEYQKLWGSEFTFNKDVNTNSRYSNNKGGERMIKSISGNAVGHGGHFNIIDDINRQQDIIYKTLRDRTNAFLESSILVRQDNTTSGVTIMIMQRLHEEDGANLLLSKNLPGTVHLMLPMEFDPSRACTTIPLTDGAPAWKDPRTKDHELLWPARFPRHYVDELKKILRTSYNISSQLQQLPTAESGTYFKRDWFRIWAEERTPKLDFVMQSWDTAVSTEIDACLSACTTWGLFRTMNGAYNVILLNCWTGRLEQPDLRRMIIQHARNYHSKGPEDGRSGPKADMVLIEEAFTGKGLIQDLKPSGIPVFAFNPRHHGLPGHQNETSKNARARLASVLVEQGIVWLPSKDGILLSFAERVLKAALACPVGKDQDIIDTMSQAFIEMRKREMIYVPDENPANQSYDWRNDPNLLSYMGNMTMSNNSAL